jgi:hypothetical protein
MNETILTNFHQKSYFPCVVISAFNILRRVRQLIHAPAIGSFQPPSIKVAALHTVNRLVFPSLMISYIQLHRPLRRDDLQGIIVEEGTVLAAAWKLPLQRRPAIDCLSILDFHNRFSLGARTRKSLVVIGSLASAMQHLHLFYVLIASPFWFSPSRAQDQVEQCAVRC